MSAIESAGLALCADKFMIPRLVQKALKRLKPTSAEDVFPALICVTYANFPDLETQVCKIIQQKTDKVVGSADFLKLDEASVLFILKQDTLKIDEVELWKHVVRWAEHQVEMNLTRTVRDCLTKILGYVRFLTFTSDEILKHVLPTEALSSDEFVDLAFAVTKNQPLKSSLLCNVREKRNIYEGEEMEGQNIEEKIKDNVEDDESEVHNSSEKECESNVFDKKSCYSTLPLALTKDQSLKSSLLCNVQEKRNINQDQEVEIQNIEEKMEDKVEGDGSKVHSNSEKERDSIAFDKKCCFSILDHRNFVDHGKYSVKSSLTIIPHEPIEIESFICGREDYTVTEQCLCSITLENESGIIQQLDTVKVSAAPFEALVIPLKFHSGLPIKMNPEEKWKFNLSWVNRRRGQSLYYFRSSDQIWGYSDRRICNKIVDKDLTIMFDSFVVYKIDYRKQ